VRVGRTPGCRDQGRQRRDGRQRKTVVQVHARPQHCAGRRSGGQAFGAIEVRQRRVERAQLALQLGSLPQGLRVARLRGDPFVDPSEALACGSVRPRRPDG